MRNVRSRLLRLSDGPLINETEASILALNGPDPVIPHSMWPAFVTHPKVLLEMHIKFRDVHKESLTGNYLKIAEKKVLRHEFCEAYIEVADFVSLAAKKDPTVYIRASMDKLMSPGSTPAQRQQRISPKNFDVKNGAEVGQAYAKAGGASYYRSYEVYYSLGDPSNESNWQYLAVYATASKMELKGLESGKMYWFRVRGVARNGPGPWSDPKGLVVT